MRIESDFGGHSAQKSETKLAPSDCYTAEVSLQRLFETATFFQCDDVAAEQLAIHTSEIQPGDVCIFRAGQDDPTQFAAIALAKGAKAILTEQLLPCPLPQVVVGDVEMAAGELMNELCDRPGLRMMMIGVVGNAGKTTTSLMVAGVLRSLGIRTAYETDLGTSDGIVQTVDDQSTACGAALISRLSDARDAGCGATVIEFGHELAAVHTGVLFDLLIVTGSASTTHSIDGSQPHFGPDPLMVAFEHVAKDGVVIVPADHPKLVRRVDDSGHKRMTYGLRREADLAAKVFDSQAGEMTLMVTCGDETAAMETKHCGEAMAMNQLAAIAVAMLLETSLVDAIEKVTQVPVVPGRMQRICGYDKASIVIDAGGEWSRIATALRTLRQQRDGGKLWCVMTLDQANPNQHDDTLAICGRSIERYADRIVLTSTPECKPHFLQSVHGLLDGFREVAVARLVADRKRAMQWVMKHASPEDTILVLGGINGTTAYQRRSRIQSLEKLIQQCQTEPSKTAYSGPATVPFPVVK